MAGYPGIHQLMMRYRLPKTLIWVANLFILFLLIFTLYRFITFFAFRNKFYPEGIDLSEVLPSFLMGIRYDLRWISFALLPIVLVSMLPRLSPFYSARNKKIWTLYLAIVTFIVFFFFAAGFGSLSYNQTPLDAGAMNFVEDFSISLRMMSQTYPLFWMLLGLVAAVVFFRWMYHRSHWQVINRTDGKGIVYRRKHFVIASLVLLIFMWGNFSWPPLGRNDSFRFHNAFKSYLAINPLQNFFATLRLRKPEANEIKARKAFPIMAKWMPLDDPTQFNYQRIIAPRSGSIETRPNIVLVQCESFSMYKTSMSGNPLDATPYLNNISKQGIFFEKCFTPHFSTARGIFAILTGIPDAQLFKFSSRNPEAVNQHTIVNSLEDYNKHYFLGGDPEFGNFEGLLKNIQGLQMHTSGSFREPEINVWGISDKDLFLEANAVFRKEAKPFFAYIQTSGNHRPYDKSISPRDTDFHKIVVPDDQLLKYGFGSLDEFNAFRYFDYCIQEFLSAAEKEPYFQNTIFVFVGDHGVAGNAEAIYPSVWTSARLTDEHVPLLFYAPQLLTPEWRKEVVSQVDVLPTIAGLIHIAYKNTSLGRDLLDPNKKNNFAFITNTAGGIGMVTDDFYFTRNINFPDEELLPLHNNHFTSSQKDSAKTALSAFTNAYFETARYLILNNKK
ncbi:MAG: LTA synthase family protein [Chitinophagaceae bacterium]|nr:LTA synthase family protein [Chitinophagaceae bacterium]